MSEKEIKQIFSELKNKIKPSEELARKILAGLDISEKPEKNKGRLLNNELILNQIHIFMNKWKFAIPILLVVLVVAGVIILRPDKKQAATQEQKGETEGVYVQVPAEVPVPAALGTIDDVIDTMTAFAENEQVITIEEGNDASMVTIDNEAISDFGQSYNEKEF